MNVVFNSWVLSVQACSRSDSLDVQKSTDGEREESGERGGGASTLYLEIMELDWDWVEEVVAALS